MKKILFVLTALLVGISSPQLFAESHDVESSVVGITKESKTVKIKITGMTCGGCAKHVSTTVSEVEGVVDQELEYPGDIAVVTFNPEETNEKEIIKAISGIGYKAEVVKEGKETKEEEKKACTSKSKGCCKGDK